MAYPNRNPSQIALDLEGEDAQNRPTIAEQVAYLKGAPTGPDFDGETYDPATDYERLSQQLRDVWDTLTGNPEAWWTLPRLRVHIEQWRGRHHSEAGLSARLRDLRKPKYGRYVVERKSHGGGLFAYRLDPEHLRARGVVARG